MNNLFDYFANRRLFVDLLLKADNIAMNISKLVNILETLKNLESETIIYCLKQDSKQWESIAIQSFNKEDIQENELSLAKLEEIYNKYPKKADNPVPLKQMFAISEGISLEVEQYKHCRY